jgi:hypothetical protein
MRDFPRKNCLVAGSMAMFSAVCFAGAACFFAKGSQKGLVPLYIVLAMSQTSLAAILFRKASKSR